MTPVFLLFSRGSRQEILLALLVRPLCLFFLLLRNRLASSFPPSNKPNSTFPSLFSFLGNLHGHGLIQLSFSNFLLLLVFAPLLNFCVRPFSSPLLFSILFIPIRRMEEDEKSSGRKMGREGEGLTYMAGEISIHISDTINNPDTRKK